MSHKLNLKMLKSKYLIILLVCLVFGLFQQSFAQGVKIGDNPSNINAAALLELQSTKAGLLLPRMNTTQMNAIPVSQGASQLLGSNGLVVYNMDSACICYYNGTTWRSLCALMGTGNATAENLKTLGILKVNGGNVLNGALLKAAELSIDTSALAKILSDTVKLIDLDRVLKNGNISTRNIITSGSISLGNNSGTVNPNAAVDISSTNKGILFPRVDLTSTTSAQPMSAHVLGMVVYNKKTTNNSDPKTNVIPGFYYNDGSKWVLMITSSNQESQRSGDIDMAGDNILNAGSVQSANFQIFDENLHTFFGGSDVNATTIINREINKTFFTDGRNGNKLLTITNSSSAGIGGGQIGIGTGSPDSSAILDLTATDKGFLAPRMTEAQKNSIVKPATGLIVFCKDCNTNGCLQINLGTPLIPSWQCIGTSTSSDLAAKKLTTSGLIKVNGGTSLDSSVLKATSLTVDTAGLTKIIADSIAGSKTVLDSLAKGLTKSPVKDTLLSIVRKDTAFTNNIIKVIKDSVTVNKSLKDSIFSAVKANGKTLTTDGLVLVNGATSLDSVLLKAAKLTIDSGALAKAIVKSPIKDSIASLIKKDTAITNNIIKIIKDSVTVNKSLKDSIFSAVKANGKTLTTSGLIKVNGGTSLDSSLLKEASLTVDTAGLTKIISDSIAGSKIVLDSLAKGITKSPVKDTINSIIDSRIGNNAVQHTLTSGDVANGFADITVAASTGYTTTAKLFVSIETDNFAIAVSIGRSNRTASSVRIYFGAAAIGDKINLLIVK
jgi:hypothetical protein